MKVSDRSNVFRAELLREAVIHNGLKVLKFLIERGFHVNQKCYFRGYAECALLNMACYLGHVDIVQYLLENGAEAKAPAYGDETLLHYVVKWRYTHEWSQKGGLVEMVQILKLLIDHDGTSEDFDRDLFTQYAPFWSDIDLMCLIDHDAIDDDNDAQEKGSLLQSHLVESRRIPEERKCEDCGWLYSGGVWIASREKLKDQGNQDQPRFAAPGANNQALDSTYKCSWCRLAWLRYWRYAEGTRCWLTREYGGLASWDISEVARIDMVEDYQDA